MAKSTVGSAFGTANIKEETKAAEGIAHIFSHTFNLSFELSSVSRLFPSVGLTLPEAFLLQRSLKLKHASAVDQFFQSYTIFDISSVHQSQLAIMVQVCHLLSTLGSFKANSHTM